MSPSFFSQFVAQNADIPVPGARGVPGYGGLQGFLPEQSSFSSVGQTIDIPVAGCGVSGNGGVQGVHPGQGSLQRTVEQIVTFLFPVEVLKNFSQILIRQLLLQFRVKSCFEEFFALFTVRKKVRRLPGVRVRRCTRTRPLRCPLPGGSEAVHGGRP